MNIIKIIVIVIAVFILFNIVNMIQKREMFKTITEQQKPEVHARLDKFGRQIYVSNKPPYRLGEYSCNKRECPDNYDNDVTCWGCHEMTAKPEYY